MSNEELVRVIMFLDPATDYNSYKYVENVSLMIYDTKANGFITENQYQNLMGMLKEKI